MHVSNFTTELLSFLKQALDLRKSTNKWGNPTREKFVAVEGATEMLTKAICPYEPHLLQIVDLV